MKTLNTFFLIMFAVCFLSSKSYASTACAATSTAASHQGLAGSANYATNGDDGYCFHTPTSMKVTVYEFGLCTAASSPTSKTACTTIFNNTSGKILDLGVGSSLPLSDSVSLTEGTYTHAYVVLSNVTSIKSVIQFSTARVDDTNNSGTYCYTDGRSVNDTPTPESVMSCGSNGSNAAYAVETIGLGGNTYSNTYRNYTVSMGGANIVSNLYAITSSGALSSAGNDFALYGSQKLASAVNITPDTKGLDIAFSITDGVTLGFGIDHGPGVAAGQTGPNDAVFEGLRFKITAR